MNTKMSLSSLNITPAWGAKKKTQQMNKSAGLQSTYLQQFKWYPVPLLEEQVHQGEEEEVPQAEAHQVEPEEEIQINPLKEMENPWAHYQRSLKEIT